MKSISIQLIIVFISLNSLFAKSTEEQLKKLNVKADFNYENAFSHQSYHKISSANILFAGFTYRSSEMDFEVFSTNHYFLIDRDNISMFATPYQLFTSPEFLKTVRKDFKITNKDEAAMFQDFLYLIDQQSSWTNFFQLENDWYFVRGTSFDDVEAWKINTDKSGIISSIEYSDEMPVTIPEDAFQVYFPFESYEDIEGFVPSDKQLEHIQALVKEKVKYSESVEDLNTENLSAISDALFYRFIFSLEEEIIDEEYGNYTSTHDQIFDAILFDGNISLSTSFQELLSSTVFVESIKSSFYLKSVNDASVFEAMLDDHTDYMRSEKTNFMKDEIWFFVRDDSFGEKVGFAVKLDDNGKILNIEYSYQLNVEVPEEEFDESTADWGFKLSLPESNKLELVEGTPINYIVEFNEQPVSKMGAWILVNFDEQNSSMYAGTEIYSPYYGDIPGEAMSIGKHNLDIYLMRPGMDLETALDKASVEINVIAFNDEGVTWDFKMEEPKSNTVKAKTGESIPVALSYNSEDANRLGVRIDIYFEGQLVGGQKAPNHESPFKIDIPGGELKSGNNKVEFVFAGGTKELARFEVNVVVE